MRRFKKKLSFVLVILICFTSIAPSVIAAEQIGNKQKLRENRFKGELLDIPRIKDSSNIYEGLSEQEVEKLKSQNRKIEKAAAKGDKDAIEVIEFANKMKEKNQSILNETHPGKFTVQASAPKIDEYIRVDSWEITEYGDIMVWYTVKKSIPNQYYNFSFQARRPSTYRVSSEVFRLESAFDKSPGMHMAYLPMPGGAGLIGDVDITANFNSYTYAEEKLLGKTWHGPQGTFSATHVVTAGDVVAADIAIKTAEGLLLKFKVDSFIASVQKVQGSWFWKFSPYVLPAVTKNPLPAAVEGNCYNVITTYNGSTIKIVTELWQHKDVVGHYNSPGALRGTATHYYNLRNF